MKKHVFLYLLVLLCLSGCCKQTQTPSVLVQNLVEEITITRQAGGKTTSHTYTDEESLQKILLYLRCLKFKDDSASALDLKKDTVYQITTVCSAGRIRTYTQRGDRYFLDSVGNWREIDPGSSQLLSNLIQTLNL